MKQDNKGITLITLVITVVVLTILAGVSINAVVGDDGIIAKAKESANLTKETTIKESIEKLVLEYKLAEKGETLEDFLKTKIPSKIDKVTNNGDGTLTIEKDGVTVTVNATHTSNPSTPTKPTINLDNLQIGDYVNYTYDTASDYGTVAQTIGLKWRILNIDKENNVIDIISDSPTDAKKYFGGISGYYNGSYYLNEICKAHYSNKKLGVEARSVNLLDMEKQLTSAGIEARNSYKDTYGTLYGTAQTNSIGSCYYPKLYANQIGAGINTADVTQPDITKGNDPYEESKKIATTEPVTDTTIEDASDNGLTTTQTLYEIDINETNYGKAASILISDMYWVAARYVSNSTENPFGDGEKIKSATFGIRFAGVVTGGISMLTSDPDTGSAVSEIRIRPLVSLEANLFTGMKDSSGAWNLKDSSSSDEPSSPYMNKNTEVTYPDGTVWIPEGFKIADDSASTVQGGVVIEDKDGNQFVWVPVATIADYKRIEFHRGTLTLYSENLATDEENSITKYKGFYIGRFEAGDKESTESKKLREYGETATNTVTIKADQAPYNCVTIEQARSLAEDFKTQQNYNATIKTKLVSSYAWDTTLCFIQKIVDNYGNSSPQGNYTDTTFSYTDITGASKTKEKNSKALVPTGQTTPVCNIYDMGGNVYEWTTETCSTPKYPYTIRGNGCDDHYVNASAGGRSNIEDRPDVYFGFRITLFL